MQVTLNSSRFLGRDPRLSFFLKKLAFQRQVCYFHMTFKSMNMKTTHLKFLYLVLLVSLSSCIAENTSEEVQKWQVQAADVNIVRDDFGVPHIYGKTDADAVFGLLYAQCEDDFNRIEQNYIWATGRLAEVEGEEAIYSDLRAKLFMTEEEAKMNYEKSPAWLKKLCDAFADGINYYLHTHPEVKPRLLTHFEPWMPMYFSEGSIGGDIERIHIEKIKAFYETGMPQKAHEVLEMGPT